jgi:hypothetical protein
MRNNKHDSLLRQDLPEQDLAKPDQLEPVVADWIGAFADL